MFSEIFSRISRRKTQSLLLSSRQTPNLPEQAVPAPAVEPMVSTPASEYPPSAVAFAEEPSAISGISFAVDEVEPARQYIWTEALIDSLSRRFQRRILALPETLRPVVNSAMDTIIRHPFAPHPKLNLAPEYVAKIRAERAARLRQNPPGSQLHPLLEAIHIAFAEHRPLALSPDSVWLAIAQGFSHHVAENAEMLQGRLVRHTEKRTLRATITALDLANFERAISGFSEQIREATDPVLHETLVCDFSTTTPAIRTASEVVLMDAFSSYFEYMMMCVCGIPRITLTGAPEDWQRIRSRVEVLATYEFEWWVRKLRPILDEFVATSEGRANLDFWRSIYKPEKAYATERATGWITDLFPYLGDAPKRRRNPALEQERDRWALPKEMGIGLKQFPSGLSSVPIEVSLRDGSKTGADLVAGFFAVEQRKDFTINPVISWSVAEPRPKAPVRLIP